MAAGVPTIPDPYSCAVNCSDSCAYYRLCLPPPPPSPAATMNLRSSRLPTQLMALSASLLAVSAVLLLALLFHRLVRRRRRRRRLAQQNAPLAQIDEEGGAVLAAVVEEVGDDEEEVDGDIGVHHVWYIRTKGLDERAIAAVVYDAKKRGALASGDGSCSVCLAEFRDGETLRLLPRCSHAFHRGCIDTWLRAHVNCPLCRAPVQVAAAAAARRGRGESRRRRWRSDGGRRARRPPTGARRQEGRVHGGAAAAGVAGRLVPSAGVEQRALVGDDGARQDQEAAEVLRSNGDGRHRCRPADLVRRRELPELAGEVRPVGRRRRQRRCNGNITVNCQDMTMDSAEKLQFWRGEVGVGLQSFICLREGKNEISPSFLYDQW